jgi:hypothetical protein
MKLPEWFKVSDKDIKKILEAQKTAQKEIPDFNLGSIPSFLEAHKEG